MEELLKPFWVSFMIFFLVSINTCIDLYFKLQELGASQDNISKGRMFWMYFSATYSYILRTILSMFAIFASLAVFVIIVVCIVSIFFGGKAVKEAGSKEEIFKAIISFMLDRCKKYLIKIFTFVFAIFTKDEKKVALKAYFIIFPIFMLVFMTAYVIGIYEPTPPVEENDNEPPKQSLVMLTTHNYLYYLFVIGMISVIMLVLYEYIMADSVPKSDP